MNDEAALGGWCATCDRPLPSESPRGLCPYCLWAAAEPAVERRLRPEPGPRSAGRFQLIQELGRGGCGVVYLAKDPRTGEECAVKVLLPGGEGSVETRLRFATEAAAVARLEHPNIVRLLEISDAEGPLWYAMRLVRGGDLAGRLRRALPNPAIAARWIETLADAVGHAHAKGVLHRDLKPANVLLDELDGVYLTDFGLAKFIQPPTRASLGLDLTLAGGLLGSVNYMAPEQVRGEPGTIGPAGDIYGLGAVLYHCLTGRPPFVHGSAVEVLRMVENAESIPPRSLNGSVPIDLESICLKCLEKEPGRRYLHAGALADDLGRYLRGQPTVARPVAWVSRVIRAGRRHPGVSVLAGALVVAIAIGSAGFSWEFRNTRRANRSLSALRDRQSVELAASLMAQGQLRAGVTRLARALRENPGNVAATTLLSATLAETRWAVPVYALGAQSAGTETVRFSPDGEMLATIQSAGPGRRGIAIWSQTHREPIARWPVPGGEVEGLEFSRDSRSVRVRLADGKSSSWTLDGAPNTAVQPGQFPEPIPPAVDWLTNTTLISRNPRLERVVSFDDTAVTLWDSVSRRRVAGPFIHEELTEAGGFTPGPGGEKFCTAINDSVRWRDAATGALLCETSYLPGVVQDVAWSADGTQTVIACHQGPVSAWTVDQPSVGPMDWSVEGMVRRLAFSPDGQQLAVGTAIDRTYWLPTGVRSGAGATHTVAEPGFAVAFFADGQRIATASQAGLVTVRKTDKAEPIFPPMAAPAGIDALAVSPDQRWVAAATTNQMVCLWDASTGSVVGEPVRLRPDGEVSWGINRVLDLRFSPDSRFLAAASSANAAVVIEVPSLRVRHRREHPGPCSSTAFSPDGRWVAFGSMAQVVDLIDLKEGAGAELPHPGKVYSVAFDGDGRRLVSSDQTGAVRVWSVPEGALIHELSTDGTDVQWADFSPDGRVIAAVTWSGRLWRWEASLGIPLGKPVTLGNRKLLRGRFSPDGRQLAVGSIGGQVWILPNPVPAGPSPAWLPGLAEALVGERSHEDGRLERIPVEAVIALRHELGKVPMGTPWDDLAHRFSLPPQMER